MSSTSAPQLGQVSTRVALTATGVVAVVYLLISVAIVAWLTLSLTAQVDERLSRALRFEVSPLAEEAPGSVDDPLGEPPLAADGPPPELRFGRERVSWHIGADGTVVSNRSDLRLPAAYLSVVGPTTVVIDDNELRIDGAVTTDGHVVVGESMDAVNDARTMAIVGLVLIAPFLLGAVFVGSVAIGRRVAMPIEQARQRQSAFTADASHELRTPVAVIEANASLALEGERDGAWYRSAFERVLAEARRMHRLIDDLLWLARFDATQKPTADEPVDLGVLAEQAAERFASVAEARSISLAVDGGESGAAVAVPGQWIDQLLGVLLDNACKYAPEGGHVSVTVETRDGRAWLIVDDDGPGIPEAQRERIFDRFHRETSDAGGSGLGLAIGDTIVRATDGRWRIERSPANGARMAVGWTMVVLG